MEDLSDAEPAIDEKPVDGEPSLVLELKSALCGIIGLGDSAGSLAASGALDLSDAEEGVGAVPLDELSDCDFVGSGAQASQRQVDEPPVPVRKRKHLPDSLNPYRDTREYVNASFPNDRLVKGRIIKKVLRRESQLEGRALAAEKALAATSEAYNRNVLRQRDHIDPLHDQRARRGRKWYHSAQWTFRGAIRIAFCAVGMLAKMTFFTHATKRVLDAVAGVALAARQHFLDATHIFVDGIQLGAQVPMWVWADREMDCTPIRVRFGMLRGGLARLARYWVRDGAQGRQHTTAGEPQRRWKLVSTEEFKELKAVTPKLPQYGIVEMLGQSGRLAWVERRSEDLVVVHRKKLLVPPVYLERANSSCMLTGYNQADPSLSIEQLTSLNSRVRLTIIGIGSDSAASCGRMKIAMGDYVVKQNASSCFGRTAFLTSECAGHILHREGEHNGTKHLANAMHATAWTFSLTDTFGRVTALLRDIVRRDLASGFYPHTAPPEHLSNNPHKFTLFRLALRRLVVQTDRSEAAQERRERQIATWEGLYERLCNGLSACRNCFFFMSFVRDGVHDQLPNRIGNTYESPRLTRLPGWLYRVMRGKYGISQDGASGLSE